MLIWKKNEPKVFNWSELHFSEVISHKIHILEMLLIRFANFKWTPPHLWIIPPRFPFVVTKLFNSKYHRPPQDTWTVWFTKSDIGMYYVCSCGMVHIFPKLSHGILLPKLYCEKKKKILVIEEKLVKFEAKGREFAKILRSLEQFIHTVKG